ncbi:AraC family transcriptional regulator [Phenylobacterium sp. LjRoot225]|uniref:helix-turn-helix domain-containing protein n=1 Tax=Phenylobacterium sp. LjRoot225 TaxID=3342285 RepID=UPI003ECEA101
MTVQRSPRGSIEVEAECGIAGVTAQLAQFHFACPPDSLLRLEDRFRVELCLTSRHRSSRACFRDFWSDRFERVGDLFLVPPGLDLLVRSDEEASLRSIVVEIQSEYFYGLIDEPPAVADAYLAAALDIQNPKARCLLVRVAEEVREPGFASAMLLELLARHTAIELVRYGKTIDDCELRGGLASWQLRLIDERLKEMSEAPTLSELSELCHISIRQLSRGFRASRGCAIGAYVANNQTQHAKRLLAAGQSVALIAGSLGFSSSSNFSVAFRRATGLTPTQYRNSLLRH